MTENTGGFINFYGRRVSHLTDSHKQILATVFPQYNLQQHADINAYLQSLQSKYSAINLEIGFGGGDFLLHSAINRSNEFFIGAEVFVNGVVNLLKNINNHNKPLHNISIYNNNVYLLLSSLPKNFFNNIYILFPDPWPKSKHKKRRLINKSNLKIFYNILKPNGTLRFVSDSADYINWSLQHFLPQSKLWQWQANNPLSFNTAPVDHVITKYHSKAIKQKHSVTYLQFIKKELTK